MHLLDFRHCKGERAVRARPLYIFGFVAMALAAAMTVHVLPQPRAIVVHMAGMSIKIALIKTLAT
jgi:hypothetical protein